MKFGFNRNKKHHKSFDMFQSNTNPNDCIINLDGTWFVNNVMIANNINFVHQLQNLYFALTGEELTLKKIAVKKFMFSMLMITYFGLGLFFRWLNGFEVCVIWYFSVVVAVLFMIEDKIKTK